MESIQGEFGNRVEISGDAAGMHLGVIMRDVRNDEAMRNALRDRYSGCGLSHPPTWGATRSKALFSDLAVPMRLRYPVLYAGSALASRAHKVRVAHPWRVREDVPPRIRVITC